MRWVISTGRQFLPTPSARRATFFFGLEKSLIFYFYPRPPRGGRQHIETSRRSLTGISTHALREEGDSRKALHPFFIMDFYPRPPRGGRQRRLSSLSAGALFLPTPSARRATPISVFFPAPPPISTHALREEGDSIASIGTTGSCNFYPRPPRGGRPVTLDVLPPLAEFLPTPSARRATAVVDPSAASFKISTHALREEGDSA